LAALSLALTLVGCARFRSVEPVKYQTVSASGNHDTTTAKQKHASALVYLEKNLDFDRAEQLLQEALVADVTYGPAHNSLGTLYYLQKKPYLAAWEFEYAAKLMPDLAEPYNNLGLVYEQAGKYEDAITYYSMALSRAPNNPELTGNLVRTRMVSGDRSADLKQLLSDMALNHTRPNWQSWARDQVELVRFEEQTVDLSSDWNTQTPAAEQLPPPDIPTNKELQQPRLELPESVLPEVLPELAEQK